MMPGEQKSEPARDQPKIFQIRIHGHLSQQWTDWFDRLTITLEEDGTTLVSGPVVDQSALHGILKKNGVEATFELLHRDPSAFQQVLVDALNRRDYELQKILMDRSFMIGYWLSEGTENTPDDAIEQLQTNLLSPTALVTPDYSKNLRDLLGTDPVTILGPDVSESRPVFVSGLGIEGKDEGILFVAKEPDGGLYWHGLLFAEDGFAQPTPVPVPTQPVDMNAYETNVKQISVVQTALVVLMVFAATAMARGLGV